MIIYHLAPRRDFEAQDANAEYFPKPYAQDGFIHCTRDGAEMARVANRFYKDERGPHVYLYIDTRKLKAKVKYKDPHKKYPHIYGGLNREAIVAVKAAPRDKAGRFQAPAPL